MYVIHSGVRKMHQERRKGVNDDGEVLKGNEKALSGDGEALRMTERYGEQWRGTAYAKNCDA